MRFYLFPGSSRLIRNELRNLAKIVLRESNEASAFRPLLRNPERPCFISPLLRIFSSTFQPGVTMSDY